MLWEYFGSLADQTVELLVIARDFNAIVDGSERVGGANSTENGCMHLRDFMFNNSLHDLGFSGSHFTWNRGGFIPAFRSSNSQSSLVLVCARKLCSKSTPLKV